ncbi:lysophospholipid acyltransferase family protein [Holophaga foetida]|uniref:lysophospholipid acyltransferase family protein n=1 Tax=Holophaga foetida TaxID=35839 RepID=UPI0002473779|nr:lysophospholipid acyltransferase family protein [Holophaga foetida]
MACNTRPNLKHWIEFSLFKAAEVSMRAFSWGGACRLGAALGRLVWFLDPAHRRIVRRNLRESDLGLEESEVRRLTKQCFANFGSMLMATLRMLTLEPERIRELVRIEGLEHFDAAAAEGKGTIALTGHFGNWELMALGLSLEGRPLAVIGRELDNPLLEPHLSGLRGRFGNSVIAKNGAVRESLKALKQGKAIGFLLDQDALKNGVFTQFFGRWASTFPTAGMLATRYDLPILPIFNRVHPDGTVTVLIRPPFHAPRTGNPEQDTWTATQLMTRCIEDEVRQDPAWWFWMHRRFKTQPKEGGLPSQA